jgi:hypothetical protein
MTYDTIAIISTSGVVAAIVSGLMSWITINKNIRAEHLMTRHKKLWEVIGGVVRLARSGTIRMQRDYPLHLHHSLSLVRKILGDIR